MIKEPLQLQPNATKNVL